MEISTYIGNLRGACLVKLKFVRMEKPCDAIGMMPCANILAMEIPSRLGLLFTIQLLFCPKDSQVQLEVVLSNTDSYSYDLHFWFPTFGLDFR